MEIPPSSNSRVITEVLLSFVIDPQTCIQNFSDMALFSAEEILAAYAMSISFTIKGFIA